MQSASAVSAPVSAKMHRPRQRVTILGATGSIGANTLDLLRRSRGDYEVVALTADRNVEALASAAIEFDADVAVIARDELYEALRDRLAGSGVEAAAGRAALIEAATRPTDWCMAAIIGSAGLMPTLAALESTERLALANKECLVSAGEIFMNAVARTSTALLPVDSEHSAVFQVLEGGGHDGIEKMTITASGGPFLTWSSEQILNATPAEAIRHPNWSMGAKISVDSATLMNKGLELIEAYHLFPVEASQLDVLVHPQSVVHCLVSYGDGSVLAQMCAPDMRTPIAYSLAWPERMDAPTERLDLARLGCLTFERPDLRRFPCLKLATEALESGAAACNVLNSANETAVEAFLAGRLRFGKIAEIVSECLQRADGRGLLGSQETLDQVSETDCGARRLVCELLDAVD